MTTDILFSELSARHGKIGKIVLNRPTALNALTTEMCQLLLQQLTLWQQNPDIKAVIITGEGERAFCAGGDIRTLYKNGKNSELSKQFFYHEYQMNAAIFHFPKPYIALLNGIAMGGGAGVSLHGSHPVASEKLLFAMPECSIGFFPDIGATHFLSKCPYPIGLYLALTGARINAQDALEANLVRAIISSKNQTNFVELLCDQSFKNSDAENIDLVTEILKNFCETHPVSIPAQLSLENKNYIKQFFSAASLEEILQRLTNDSCEWAKTTFKLLSEKSPTSLKVTFEQFKRASALNLDLDQILEMDFNIASEFLKAHDFFEGVRAVMIDKNKPVWEPAELNEITDESLQKFFNANCSEKSNLNLHTIDAASKPH